MTVPGQAVGTSDIATMRVAILLSRYLCIGSATAILQSLIDNEIQAAEWLALSCLNSGDNKET